MRPSRGMGAISPSKMPGAKKKARKDDTDFTQYKEGGTVNKAGNYTLPSPQAASPQPWLPKPPRAMLTFMQPS